MPTPRLPYGRHWIDEADVAAVVEVLKSDFLTTGPVGPGFEVAFAAALGAAHAVAVNSGTAALHLALLTLDLPPGARVVVPAISFVATANVVAMVGGTVVFADTDPESGLLTPDSFAAALAGAGGPVAAVIPVHLGGATVALDAIGAIADDHGIAVVEDACHALGSRVDGVAVGARSAAAAFSLHPVKTLAAGEGGVLVTDDAARADRARRLRSHGIARAGFVCPDQALDAAGAANPWYYEMQALGYNYRLSDINAALALSQLRRLDAFVARRRALADAYDRRLAALAPALRPVPAPPATQAPAWHLYRVLLGDGICRAALMRRLAADGIATQVHYIPIHRQPWYWARVGDLRLPGADAYYRRCLSLPLFPRMAEHDVERVANRLGAALAAAA